MAKDNKTIGRFHLEGIPPAGRGTPQIEVTFDIDANGLIHVTALDKQTNKSQDIRIEASSGLSDKEIEQMKADAEANAEADKKAKETADKVNTADGMIFQTEKQLKDNGDKLSDGVKKPIEDALATLKKAHEAKDLAGIDAAMETINKAWEAAGPEMQKAAQEEQAANAGEQQAGGDAGTKNDGDNVEDVDFEEV
jgi:molecular chaperone DnaK